MATYQNFHIQPRWDLDYIVTQRNDTNNTFSYTLNCYPVGGGWFGFQMRIGIRTKNSSGTILETRWSNSITGRVSVGISGVISGSTSSNTIVEILLSCTAYSCGVGATPEGIARFSMTYGLPYTNPNIAISYINNADLNSTIDINANTDLSLGWTAWANSTSSDKAYIDAKYDSESWKQMCDTSEFNGGKGSGNKGYHSPINGGATFDNYDNKTMYFSIRRRHAYTGNSATDKKLLRILFTPTKQITSFTMSESGLLNTLTDIVMSWNYPTNGQYGIVSGYELRLINKDTEEVVKKYVTDNSYKSITIPANDYQPINKYYVQIYPFYKISSDKNSYGPVYISKEFQVVRPLNKVTIEYPKTNSDCIWIGNKLYILFPLPEDPDYEYLSNSYTYKDIRVSINSIAYFYSENKSMFSVDTLSYKRKVVFSTKNINISMSSTYTIKVEVQKSYNNEWNEGTQISLKSTQVPSIPSFNKGDYINKSHYNNFVNYIKGMRNCYKLSSDNIQTEELQNGTDIWHPGEIISRSNYNSPYNDLIGISNLIDTYSNYDNSSIKTGFKPVYNPIIETVMNTENYIQKVYEWIRQFS